MTLGPGMWLFALVGKLKVWDGVGLRFQKCMVYLSHCFLIQEEDEDKEEEKEEDKEADGDNAQDADADEATGDGEQQAAETEQDAEEAS